MNISSCLNISGSKYQILYGLDEMLLSGLTAGAERIIGSIYNFMAFLYHRIRKISTMATLTQRHDISWKQ